MLQNECVARLLLLTYVSCWILTDGINSVPGQPATRSLILSGKAALETDGSGTKYGFEKHSLLRREGDVPESASAACQFDYAVGVNTGVKRLAYLQACDGTWLHGCAQKVILRNDNASASQAPALAASGAELAPARYACRDESWRCNQRRFLYVVAELYRRYPASKWFFLADDDLYVNWPNVCKQLMQMSIPTASTHMGYSVGVNMRLPTGLMQVGSLLAWDNRAAATLSANIADCFNEFFFFRLSGCKSIGGRKMVSDCRQIYLDAYERCRSEPHRSDCFPEWRINDFNGRSLWFHEKLWDKDQDDHILSYCAASRNIEQVEWRRGYWNRSHVNYTDAPFSILLDKALAVGKTELLESEEYKSFREAQFIHHVDAEMIWKLGRLHGRLQK